MVVTVYLSCMRIDLTAISLPHWVGFGVGGSVLVQYSLVRYTPLACSLRLLHVVKHPRKAWDVGAETIQFAQSGA